MKVIWAFKHRAQQGYTILEMLLAMALSAIIFVPLMAWALLAMRQQPVTQDGLLRTAQTGLLGTMFPTDVSVASQAWVNGMAEPWASDCDGGTASGGSMQLVMISGGATVQKVVYVVAKSTEDPSEFSIWRRTCGIGADSSVKKEYQLLKGVRPEMTSVSCTSPAGDAPCREIKLTTTPLRNSQPIVMGATRRIDSGSVPIDELGNPLPVAVITLVSRTAHQPIDAVFSAEHSSVGPERAISAYKWEFESDVTATNLDSPQVTAKFPPLAPGQDRREFTVRLTITDDLGATNTAFYMISSSNVDPVAIISSITPNPVDVGNVVTLTALPSGGNPGSYDPDGAIVGFEWLLTPPQPDPATPNPGVWLNGPTVTYTTGPGDLGVVDVMLSVNDLQLGQATAFGSFSVVDPTDPTDPTIPTSTVPPSLVAAFTDAPGGTSLTRTYDASTTVGAAPDATYSWDFGDGATANGVTTSRKYATGGQFNVVLTVTNPDGASVTTGRVIQISGGTGVPKNLRHNGTVLLWDPVPGARRYLVDFEFRTPTDCLKSISNQAVGATAKPSKGIPKNPCPRSATARARVGSDSGTSVTWSGWITVPTINTATTTTTSPEVVK